MREQARIALGLAVVVTLLLAGIPGALLVRRSLAPVGDMTRQAATYPLFVVSVNVLSVALAGPVSYVIARRSERRYRMLLLLFVAGTFIPSQVLVIPVVYTLKFLGLMGTIPGFVLFETTLTLPFSIFLYAGYIMTIPASLDEAAAVDGAGRHRVFWSIVFPLMKPAVVTMVILNTFSVWNDFVNPQIILGPGSGLYTVTTGVYAAVSQYSWFIRSSTAARRPRPARCPVPESAALPARPHG